MALIILILSLGLAHALEVKEIKTQILPVQLGQAKIITSKHTFLYHIKLTQPKESLNAIKTQLNSIEISIKRVETKSYLFPFLLDKIYNTFVLTQTISDTLDSFCHNLRTKRGLINVVGKMSHWLFGIMDSDSEEHINAYLKTIEDTQNGINNDLQSQKTVLKEIVNTYNNAFQKLDANQLAFKNQIENIYKRVDKLSKLDEAFTFTHILDSMSTQLYYIQDLINNIENAISFAHLNVLHSSIIKPNQLKLIISKLNTIYENYEVPKLNKLHNYYSLFSAQAIIQNDFVIFKIHVPIVTKSYKYFHLYPIPLYNSTIIPENPFLLLNTENNWSTPENCPEVEDFYYCQQEKLQKSQPCIVQLMTVGKNTCPRINLHLSATTTIQINSHSVVILPAESIDVHYQCESNGIYTVQNPVIIDVKKCKIDVQGKIFQSEETLHEQFIFELPSFHLEPQGTEDIQSPIHLQDLDEHSLRNLEILTNNLKTRNATNKNYHTHTWLNTLLLILLIILVISLVLYIKFVRPYIKAKATPKVQKTPQVVFSDLKGEELCI